MKITGYVASTKNIIRHDDQSLIDLLVGNGSTKGIDQYVLRYWKHNVAEMTDSAYIPLRKHELVGLAMVILDELGLGLPQNLVDKAKEK